MSQHHNSSARAVLIARGRVRNVWTVLVYVPATVFAVVMLGYLALLWFADARWNPTVALWLSLGTLVFAGLQVVSELVTTWIPVSRVAYFVDGSRIVARERDEVLADVDVVAVAEVRVVGQLTFAASLFTRRGASSMNTLVDLLPRVEVRVAGDTADAERIELPPILLMGSRQTDAFRKRLYAELRAAGVPETQLRR